MIESYKIFHDTFTFSCQWSRTSFTGNTAVSQTLPHYQIIREKLENGKTRAWIKRTPEEIEELKKKIEEKKAEIEENQN